MRVKADWIAEAYMNTVWANDTVVSSDISRNRPRDYISANPYGWYDNPYDFDRDWINERIRDWHSSHPDDNFYRIMQLEQAVKTLEDRIRTLEGIVMWLDWELRMKMKELEESAWFSYVKLGNDR